MSRRSESSREVRPSDPALTNTLTIREVSSARRMARWYGMRGPLGEPERDTRLTGSLEWMLLVDILPSPDEDLKWMRPLFWISHALLPLLGGCFLLGPPASRSPLKE